MRRLPRFKQPNHQEPLFTSVDWWVPKSVRTSQTIHPVGPYQRLSSDEDKKMQQKEERLQNKIQSLWVLDNVFQIIERTGQVLRIHK